MAPLSSLLARLEQEGIRLGLDATRELLAALGDPQRRFPSVLVAGTNGKGSTAALLAGVLAGHGVRTGLYTSPHLVRVEERIAVGSTPIAPGRLLDLVRRLAGFPQLSYFETLTAAAFLHFAEEGVDLAVLEAGLGGRWDATAVAEPVVSLLTNVGTDHQAWLGATRPAIAAEKAAALRGREAIIGEWDDEVEPPIRAAADPATPLSPASAWATVSAPGDRRPAASRETAPAGAGSAPWSSHEPRITSHVVTFTVAGLSDSASLPLLGRHQHANLALALAGAAALAKHRVIPPLHADAIGAGVAATAWPGRLQWVEWRGRSLLLDGAHNLEATRTLAGALAELGVAGGVDLVFSCLDDKPLHEMAALLRPLVRRTTVVALDSPRATPIAVLAPAFPGCAVAADVAGALAAAPSGVPTLVTGSLRLVGEALRAIAAGGKE